MQKFLFTIAVVSTIFVGCAKDEQTTVVPATPVCNGPSYNYGQPNCVAYNTAVYPGAGCPPGFIPLPSTAAGVPGNYCMSQMAYNMTYAQASYYGPLGNSGNLGVPQMCDSYTYNSCGTNTNLHCVAYSGRYGICR